MFAGCTFRQNCFGSQKLPSRRASHRQLVAVTPRPLFRRNQHWTYVKCAQEPPSLLDIETLKEMLEGMERERDAAIATAISSSQKSKRLMDAVERLEQSAITKVKQQDEEEARKVLEEKHKVTKALESATERAEANYALAGKLEQVIGQKQNELLKMISQAKGESSPTSYTSPSPSYQSAGVGIHGTSVTAPSPKRGYDSDEDVDMAFLRIERSSLENMLKGTPSQEDQASRAPSGQQQGSTSDSAAGQNSTTATVAPPALAETTQWWIDGKAAVSRGLLSAMQQVPRDHAAPLLLQFHIEGELKGREPRLTQSLAIVQAVSEGCSGEHGIEEACRALELEQYTAEVPQDILSGLYRSAARQCISSLISQSQADLVLSGRYSILAFLVGYSAVLGIHPDQAVDLVSQQVVENVRQMLLQCIAAVKEAVTKEEQMAMAEPIANRIAKILTVLCPPTNHRRVKVAAQKLQSFVSQKEGESIVEVYKQSDTESKGLGIVQSILGLQG